MKISNLRDFNGGWFVGDFEKSIVETKDFEVAYHFYKKNDEPTKPHMHKIATEINLVISGHIIINGVDCYSGDIFTIYPGEWASAKFPMDTEIMIVKTPSVPGDKYD